MSQNQKITDKQWASLNTLAQTPEALDLLKIKGLSSAKNCAHAKTLVTAFIKEAKKTSLPPHLWMIQKDNNKNPQNVVWLFLKKSGGLEVARECISQGASLWSTSASETTEHPYYSSYQSRVSAQKKYEWQNAIQELVEVWSRNRGIEKQGFNADLLGLALSSIDEKNAPLFLNQLAAHYQYHVRGSSRNAPGILNEADQQALSWSSMIVKNEAVLMNRLSLVPEDKAEHQKFKELITEAKERLKNKSAEVSDEVSPKQLKKSLTPQQKSRIALISAMIEQEPHDAEALKAVLGVSDFLKQKPSLASLKVNRSESAILADAIRLGSLSVVQTLADWGTNIWLASNQDDEENPIQWACNLRAYEEACPEGELMEPIGKMLLQGAWLSGFEKPKDKCLELANACIEALAEEYDDYDDEEDEDVANPLEEARKLAVILEKLTLEEIISQHRTASTAPESIDIDQASTGSEKKKAKRL